MGKINFSNLLVNLQKTTATTASAIFTGATLMVSILALVGLLFSLIWAGELINGLPMNIFHNPEAFLGIATENIPLADKLPWHTIPTNFWAFSIRLQGLIMLFIGALSFTVLSYTCDHLNTIMNIFTPSSKITFANPKMQQLNNLTEKWYQMFCKGIRKVAIWLMLTIAGTTLIYFTWQSLSGVFPV